MPTYCRPGPVANALACFLKQDYPNKYLVILDDAGQYKPRKEDNWEVQSTDERFKTLGDKRNACAALAPKETEFFAVWDDDDTYLPWHLSSVMTGDEWVVPRNLFIVRRNNNLVPKKNKTGIFHGGWCYSRELFERVNGYPTMDSGQDQVLGSRFKKAGAVAADIQGKPGYCYAWFNLPGAWHLSAKDKRKGYGTLGKLAERVTRRVKLEPAMTCDWMRKCPR